MKTDKNERNGYIMSMNIAIDGPAGAGKVQSQRNWQRSLVLSM